MSILWIICKRSELFFSGRMDGWNGMKMLEDVRGEWLKQMNVQFALTSSRIVYVERESVAKLLRFHDNHHDFSDDSRLFAYLRR